MPDKEDSSEVQFRSEKLPGDNDGASLGVACISSSCLKCFPDCHPWKGSRNSPAPAINKTCDTSSGASVVTSGVDRALLSLGSVKTTESMEIKLSKDLFLSLLSADSALDMCREQSCCVRWSLFTTPRLRGKSVFWEDVRIP